MTRRTFRRIGEGASPLLAPASVSVLQRPRSAAQTSARSAPHALCRLTCPTPPLIGSARCVWLGFLQQLHYLVRLRHHNYLFRARQARLLGQVKATQLHGQVKATQLLGQVQVTQRLTPVLTLGTLGGVGSSLHEGLQPITRRQVASFFFFNMSINVRICEMFGYRPIYASE